MHIKKPLEDWQHEKLLKRTKFPSDRTQGKKFTSKSPKHTKSKLKLIIQPAMKMCSENSMCAM